MRHLSRSQIFKDYERAFSEAMGLPLNIRGRDTWSPSHHGKEDRDSFASILARFNKARSACLKAQSDASREPESTTRTVTWFAGLSESAVPVYAGDRILGFLETGEVMLKLGVPAKRVEHLLKQQNPALIAEVVKELERKK